jgi:hypothetical protein
MQRFERSVLIVAMLILLVTLTIMGIALKQSAGKAPAPPSACPDFWFSSYFRPCSAGKFGCCDDGVTPANETRSNCEGAISCTLTPYGCCTDGYTAKTSSDGANCPEPGPAVCYNVHLLPKGSEEPVNGDCLMKNPDDFQAKNGKSALCEKQTWAKRCLISWDGVTNADDAC